MALDGVNVLLTNNMPEKAIVQSRGIIFFSLVMTSTGGFKDSQSLSDSLTWTSSHLSFYRLSDLFLTSFVVTSHVSLVLLYHNLTPTIIKGQDIELVDIWEQWWMWLWAELALRQIPEQICDKVQQCLFFPAQNKLLNRVWWNDDLVSLNQF